MLLNKHVMLIYIFLKEGNYRCLFSQKQLWQICFHFYKRYTRNEQVIVD